MSRQARAGRDVTFEAGADLSALQFTAVKYASGAAGGVDARVVGAGAGERAIGILQNKPAVAGRGAVVRTEGFSKLKVNGNSANISAGSPLECGALGVGVLAAQDKDHVFATAAAPSTADGDIIEVQITIFDLAV